jgi:GT2 family glycosyltransferase
MLKIAIVSVNFNGEKDTLELLESLDKIRNSNCEIRNIIVDNGSSDNFVKTASKKYPGIDILQTGINKGFSGGYNRGIEHGLIWGADYVLIINNDALIPDRNLILKLLDTFRKDEKIGIVAPKIYFAPGYEFHKERYRKEDQGKVVWFAGGKFDWDNVMSIHRGIDEVDSGEYSGEMEMDFATGCCFLVKREVLEKVGMFDDNYFAYFEDAEYSKRVLDAGFKIYYNGDTSIFHKVSQTSQVGSAITDYYLTRNRLMFGFKYASKRTKFALWRQAISQLMFGRNAQRKAIKDFFAGKTGPEASQKWNDEADYQVDLSVVSVNYNTPELIDALLKSITKYAIRNTRYETIILDNGSEKGCEAVVKKYLGVRFIQNQVNEGFTGGNNKLFKFSRGKYILMLNSDIEVLEGSLEQIFKEADSYSQKAIVSGSLIFPDGTQQDSVFYLPTIWGAVKEYIFALKGSFFMYAPSQGKNTKVEAAAMACFLIPRKILETVGYLDERLFTYFEDVDFCRRCKKLGIPIYYTPKAKFIHQHGATGKTLKQGRAYELLQNAAKIYYGAWYYRALSLTLRILQKISWVKTPIAR